MSRVETGAVQFNDDWPGLFIRGDDCARLRFALRGLMSLQPPECINIEEGLHRASLHDLETLLESTDTQSPTFTRPLILRTAKIGR